MQQRRYTAAEYERIEGAPLPAWRLAQIQSSLPEHDRFGFFLALRDDIGDEMMAATVKVAPAAGAVARTAAAPEETR